VAARMLDVLNEISQKHLNQEVIIIVSHGMVIATVICAAHEVGLENAANLIPQNSAVTTIHWDKNTA